MSRLLKSISDLVNEECHTTILHDNRTLSRFITYSQFFEKSNIERRDPNHDVSSAPKSNYERNGSSQVDRPTFKTFGKKRLEKCLDGTSVCYGCGKNDHKVRDCPTIASRWRDVKKFPYNSLIFC